jgi:hypothetical protein
MTSKQHACAAAVNVELYEGLLMLQGFQITYYVCVHMTSE